MKQLASSKDLAPFFDNLDKQVLQQALQPWHIYINAKTDWSFYLVIYLRRHEFQV